MMMMMMMMLVHLPMMKLMRFQHFCLAIPMRNIWILIWSFCVYGVLWTPKKTYDGDGWWWLLIQQLQDMYGFLGLRSKWGTPSELGGVCSQLLGSPLFFFLEFCGFWGSCVCVFVFFFFGCLFELWVWEEWSWSCSDSALEFSHSPFWSLDWVPLQLVLSKSVSIHLSDSLTWVPLQLVLSQSFPFTFLIPRLGYLCNWFCPRAFHSPLWFLDLGTSAIGFVPELSIHLSDSLTGHLCNWSSCMFFTKGGFLESLWIFLFWFPCSFGGW